MVAEYLALRGGLSGQGMDLALISLHRYSSPDGQPT
jgi:hypothetical protein